MPRTNPTPYSSFYNYQVQALSALNSTTNASPGTFYSALRAAQAALRVAPPSEAEAKEMINESFPPRETRYKNEAYFRKAIIAALKDKAFHAQSIESTTAGGIPDLYTVGIHNGYQKVCWAELKIVKKGNVVKVSALQWKWLTDHAKASGKSYLIVNDHSPGSVWVLKVACQSLPNLRDLKYIRNSSYELRRNLRNPLDDLVNAL